MKLILGRRRLMFYQIENLPAHLGTIMLSALDSSNQYNSRSRFQLIFIL